MQSPTIPTERPTQLILVVVLALVAGLFGMVVSALPFVATLQGQMPASLVIAVVTLSMLLAILNFPIAIGVWRRQMWAWPVAVLGLGASVAFHIIFLLIGGGNLLNQGIAIILAGAMLYLLYRSPVKHALNRP